GPPRARVHHDRLQPVLGPRHRPPPAEVLRLLPADPPGPDSVIMRFTERRGLAVTALVTAGLALLPAVGRGLLRLHVDTGVQEFVPRNDAALRTTEQIGADFGGDPVVVLFETSQPMALFSKDDLPRLLRLEGELAHLPDVQVVYGPGTVLNQI